MEQARLDEIVAADAAFRRRQRLQPSGGKGDKIFPPTYPGEGRNAPPQHVFERRRIDGEERWCVLVDSVQSQANRLEECLLDAAQTGLPLPHVVVDFAAAGLNDVDTVTSLDAPHRVYDAILRDSLLDDMPFMESDVGQRLARARPRDATALLEISPNALLFGSWHSTGEGGGLGAKFARCLVSELSAVDVPVEELADQRTGETRVRTAGRRTGSRIDPLGVLRSVPVYKGEAGWDVTAEGAGPKAKKVRPSEINHGNIAPSIQPLGVTCDYVLHTFVLSCAALRQLGFGSTERDTAGRGLLAALGLLALLEQDARGYALRSRCDLVCEGSSPLEVVAADGSSTSEELDLEGARALVRACLERCREAGFSLAAPPLRLVPQPKLVEIVRKSQELALAGAGGEEAEEG